jgi:hypothetical protein
VFGHEYYVEHLEDLACAAVPVRHPLTQRMLGVVNLTGWRRDAGGMMVATTAALAPRTEASLLKQSNRREHALLRDYLSACRRTGDAVVAVGCDLLMLNDRARRILAPADQGPLLAEAVEALTTGRRRHLLVDLPSGATARVQCEPSFSDGTAAGGVLHVQLVGGSPVPRLRLAIAPPLPAVVGAAPPWAKCRGAVDQAFRARSGSSSRASRARAGRPWPARSTRAGPRPHTCGSSTPPTAGRA